MIIKKLDVFVSQGLFQYGSLEIKRLYRTALRHENFSHQLPNVKIEHTVSERDYVVWIFLQRLGDYPQEGGSVNRLVVEVKGDVLVLPDLNLGSSVLRGVFVYFGVIPGLTRQWSLLRQVVLLFQLLRLFCVHLLVQQIGLRRTLRKSLEGLGLGRSSISNEAGPSLGLVVVVLNCLGVYFWLDFPSSSLILVRVFGHLKGLVLLRRVRLGLCFEVNILDLSLIPLASQESDSI